MLIPSRAVMISGQPTFAWWEIDPVTGETISVGENGLHDAFEYLALIVEEGIESFAAGDYPGQREQQLIDLAENCLKIGLKLREYFFAVAAGLNPPKQPAAPSHRAPLASADSSWRSLPAYLCPTAACGVEQFFLDDVNTDPIPLPKLTFNYVAASGADVVISTLSVLANGSGTPAFTLAANPNVSSITPGTSSVFQAQINSNFADDFTVAVYAPIGWAATITTTGQINIQPAERVVPGDYTIQLVAQSKLHPELIETATHTVTILNQTNALLSIVPEPKITVAMGTALITSEPNETNDGETEVPGAAYTIILTNTSGSTRTFDVAVSGPPSDWIILDAARTSTTNVELPAGGVAQIGLYVQPSNGTLPTPGTSDPINVSATSTPINVQATSSFNMPSQPFNFMMLDPGQLYLPPNSSTPVNLSIQNVGNASGGFDLSAHALPMSATLSGLPAAQSLAQGVSASLPLTLTLGAAKPGATFPLVIAGDAPNSTTEYAVAGVRVAGPYSGPIFQAADQLALCPLGEPNLSATLTMMAVSMANLEQSCDSGACDLNQRDQVVHAAQDAASFAGSLSSVITADDALLQAANTMATHTTVSDLQTDLYYYRCNSRLKCGEKYVRADIADELVWRWLVATLDDDKIELGLNRVAQRKAAELQPACARLAQIEKLIESTDDKIKRLVRDLSDEDDEILRAVVRGEVKNMTRQREGLAKEAETLRASIEQSAISDETRARIKTTIKEVRAKLDHATFAQKRFIINKLEVEVVVREDEAGRWLDVLWGVSEAVNSVKIVKIILSPVA